MKNHLTDLANRTNKKLNPYPEDWDLHVLHTYFFYFDHIELPQIEYFAASPNIEMFIGPANIMPDIFRIILFTFFKCDEKIYISVHKQTDKFISGSVYCVMKVIKIEDMAEQFEIDENEDVISFNHSLMVVREIGTFIKDTPYECAQKIEEDIKEDYWRNNGGNGGKEENNLNPSSPSPVGLKDLISSEYS